MYLSIRIYGLLDEDESVTAEPSDAKLLRDLGHPVRLRILKHLMGGEKNVGELVDLLGGPAQGRVSSHLT